MSHLASASGLVKMAPSMQETDLENFREEDDEDLKVFHKTKKATKMVEYFFKTVFQEFTLFWS